MLKLSLKGISIIIIIAIALLNSKCPCSSIILNGSLLRIFYQKSCPDQNLPLQLHRGISKICSKMINDFIKHALAFYFVLPYVAYSALITPGVTG